MGESVLEHYPGSGDPCMRVASRRFDVSHFVYFASRQTVERTDSSVTENRNRSED